MLVPGRWRLAPRRAQVLPLHHSQGPEPKLESLQLVGEMGCPRIPNSTDSLEIKWIADRNLPIHQWMWLTPTTKSG